MKTITIIGAGIIGSALAFPARKRGNEVRIAGTHLDREIIDACRKTVRHPKFNMDFPTGVTYFQIEQLKDAINGAAKFLELICAIDKCSCKIQNPGLPGEQLYAQQATA